MHFLGLSGMPRRIPDYPDAFSYWNTVSSVGSYVSLFGLLVFFVVIYNIFTIELFILNSRFFGGRSYLFLCERENIVISTRRTFNPFADPYYFTSHNVQAPAKLLYLPFSPYDRKPFFGKR